jgi:hypothetical protein
MHVEVVPWNMNNMAYKEARCERHWIDKAGGDHPGRSSQLARYPARKKEKIYVEESIDK